jgi:multidrug resistance efflux pump
VRRVAVSDFQLVKAGDLLVEIDCLDRRTKPTDDRRRLCAGRHNAARVTPVLRLGRTAIRYRQG